MISGKDIVAFPFSSVK